MIIYSSIFGQVKRDSLNPIYLDTVTVKPMLSWKSFKDSFINMTPESKLDLFQYYPIPNKQEQEIDNFLPVFEVFPGVKVLILPGYIGIGMSIDESYIELYKRSRKKKRSKVLPKFE